MTKSSNKKDTAFKQPLEFGKDQNNWPLLLLLIQDNSPEFEVELKVTRPNPTQGSNPAQSNSPTHTVTLKPYSSDNAFWHARGLLLSPLKEMHVAKDMKEQTELAFNETGSALMSVVRFLQKIGGQVSVKALGGPLTIAQVAGEAAFEGVGALLMMLVMLSANLAVLNFLPIPVLDGGHMVFLLYEGITGRPVNEKVAIALQTVGLLFLLSLMLFVTSMDISRLVSWMF
jgi:regulator of sigma E protease